MTNSEAIQQATGYLGDYASEMETEARLPGIKDTVLSRSLDNRAVDIRRIIKRLRKIFS